MAQIFTFPKPEGPECEPIENFHRAHDGMIALVPNNNFKQPYFLRPRDLQMWFPAMLEELTRDSYFSLNRASTTAATEPAGLRQT